MLIATLDHATAILILNCYILRPDHGYTNQVNTNVKKILAVINATYAVAKRKPEKIRLAGIRTLTSAIPVQRSGFESRQA